MIPKTVNSFQVFLAGGQESVMVCSALETALLEKQRDDLQATVERLENALAEKMKIFPNGSSIKFSKVLDDDHLRGRELK